MNNSLLLDKEQLSIVTGKVRWSAQIKALRQMGFEVKVRPDGFPLVDMEHYRIVMGAMQPKQTERAKLNFDHL